MCTVTWWRRFDSYEMFFNRDELKTRRKAEPPRILEREGVRFIAPADGDFGGTWIFANEHGVSAGLLNHYPACDASTKPSDPISRGLLMLDLAVCRRLQDIAERLGEMDLRRYRPFHLVAVALEHPVWLWTWDGRELSRDEEADAAMPLTTSSYASGAAVRERKQEFARRLAGGEPFTPAFLENFHKAYSSENGAFSVCMERDDAETVSLSRVCVTREGIDFTYSPKAAGKPEFENPSEVSLEVVAGA